MDSIELFTGFTNWVGGENHQREVDAKRGIALGRGNRGPRDAHTLPDRSWRIQSFLRRSALKIAEVTDWLPVLDLCHRATKPTKQPPAHHGEQLEAQLLSRRAKVQRCLLPFFATRSMVRFEVVNGNLSKRHRGTAMSEVRRLVHFRNSARTPRGGRILPAISRLAPWCQSVQRNRRRGHW